MFGSLVVLYCACYSQAKQGQLQGIISIIELGPVIPSVITLLATCYLYTLLAI